MIYKNALITNKNEQFLGWIEIDENNILVNIGKGKTNLKGYDCKKNILMPGFIDSHTHGAFGLDYADISDEKKLITYLNKIKEEGVVAVVGSTVTTALNELENYLDTINNQIHKNRIGLPSIVGWYFEGPFISKSKKGAHEEKLIIPIDENFLKLTKQKLPKTPIVFTFDAQEKQNRKLVKKYQNDFIFALGHSNANYLDTKEVLNNGTKRITHLYNAMSGFNHSKNTGILNAIFNKEFLPSLCMELITDGVHIDNEVIKYTYNNFSIDNLTLVTDSLPPKGLKPGNYKLGNLDIESKGNWFYLKGTDTLSGSGIPYNWLLNHFKEVTNCSWNEIVKVSSFNSARNLNLDDNYGDFIIGKPINFVLVDEKMNIIKILI